MPVADCEVVPASCPDGGCEASVSGDARRDGSLSLDVIDDRFVAVTDGGGSGLRILVLSFGSA